MKTIAFLLCTFFTAVPVSLQQPFTFSNPLLSSGADPWCIYKDGYYYYMHTMGNRLDLWKTKNMASLAKAEHKTIWTPPASGPYSKNIWAPEIHFLQGKWYVYFAADNGDNQYHRLYAIENDAANPMEGNWVFEGKVADEEDKWAIDGSVFEHKNRLYMIWSGWEGNRNGQQNLYIAAMKDPLTISGCRVKISSPIYDWEKQGDLKDPDMPHLDVNEGPQILKHGNKLFLVYSASACWTDQYALGMLAADTVSDLLHASTWKKWPVPVFKQSPGNGVYAPGHNSFFTSPGGGEQWILYHANDHSGDGCGNKRSPRMQQFSWKKDGTPDFGVPFSNQKLINAPVNN